MFVVVARRTGIVLLLGLGLAATAAAAPDPNKASGPEVSSAVKHDLSPPLRDLPPAARAQTAPRVIPVRPLPHARATAPGVRKAPGLAPLVAASVPTPSTTFEGVGQGFQGPAGVFTVNAAPPDTNGAVGPNHYVQTVNTDFAIFDKGGTPIRGPVPINTLWSGFGGNCEADNDGDPSVVYDPIADRWLISQFAVTNPNPSYLQCIAVSQTGDPTGQYFRYAFAYSAFPDYPKFGVWPDAYYVTYNLFNGVTNAFQGGLVCALDRTSMLGGAAATQQCFNVGTNFGGLLPATVDGAHADPNVPGGIIGGPPAGAPNHVLALGLTDAAGNGSTLAYWDFHVNWATPANSTLTGANGAPGPTTLSVASYQMACNGGTCIPQPGTSQQLDSLGDRLMYRLAYRHFGDHESLVANHSITAGASVGLRWYEIRLANGVPSIFQQGTFAPDATYRWMGSIAMDHSGDIALGYSASSSTLNPSIRYTARAASDPAGAMSQGEGSVIDGTGVQRGFNLSRWGDYSSLNVDPVDDCTFWYTNEYEATSGAFNWHTRVGSFKLAGCGAAAVTNDFSIAVNPTSLNVQQGSNATPTVSTTTTSGTAQTVNLSISGLPAGTTATFNPTSVTSGGSSTLTVSVGNATTPGTYSLTITGTGTSATHSTSLSLTVNAAPTTTAGITNGGFETGDLSGWTPAGAAATVATSPVHSGSFSARLGSTVPTNGDSSIAQTFTAPSGGGTLSFWYQVVCPDTVTFDWATATLRDNTAATTTTVLGKTCTNTGTWNQVKAALVANHSYTLTLISHDDNFSGDPTRTFYDDVTVLPPVANPIQNPGFETGSLSGWTATGPATTVTSAVSHSGTYAAQLGSTSPTTGDSAINQTFTAPDGSSQLTFWYQVVCPDTVTFDWATATLRDNTTGTTATVLPRTCTNSGAWVQVKASVTPGHSYTLTLVSHDDNFAGDPTRTFYDDVIVQ